MTKDFKGHFEPDDPRHVLWSAGGCVWPTVPPYRIRFGSPNAMGEWNLLRTAGVLLEASMAWQHDDMTWANISPVPPMLDSMWIWRHYDRDQQEITWTVFFNHPAFAFDLEIHQVIPAPQKGNETVQLDNWEWTYPIPSPGDPLELWQVYFNETQPPEGWPPWA